MSLYHLLLNRSHPLADANAIDIAPNKSSSDPMRIQKGRLGNLEDALGTTRRPLKTSEEHCWTFETPQASMTPQARSQASRKPPKTPMDPPNSCQERIHNP